MSAKLKKSQSNQLAKISKDERKDLEKAEALKEHFIESLGSNKKSLDNEEVMHALLENNYMSEKELADIFGQKFDLEVILNLKDYKIDKATLDLIPKYFCEQNLLLPMTKIDKTLIVVFATPPDPSLKDSLSLNTGLKIQPVISTRTAIREAFSKYFDNTEQMENLIYDINMVTGEEEEDALSIDLDKEFEGKQDALVSFVNLVFSDAIRLKCSDIHVETYTNTFRIRYRIDGMLYEKHTLSRDMAGLVVSRIKVISGMDISEKRKPQDARLKLRVGGKELNMRVNSTPTVNGEKVVLRILDDSALQTDLSALGMEKDQMKLFEKSLYSAQGLLLMTGPTGSGKTTTIYSGLSKLNTVDRNISTAEDPVEFRIQGINQVQMNPKAGLTFASSLRAFLRQDPDIILVGEIRDFETAEIAFKAASTGHLVLSTLHTNDTSSTVTRLISMGVPPYSVADNTSLIISQRLLRKLCQNCRVPASDSYIDALKEMGLSKEEIAEFSGKTFTRNDQGCSQCNKIGFSGRIAVYEFMEMTRTIKEGIFEKLSPLELKKRAMEKDGLRSIRMNGLEKVKQGLSTIEEVIRVTVE